MESRAKKIGLFLLRILVGGSFLVAGGIKAQAPIAFYHDIISFRLLPEILAWGVAFYLPWLEVMCGGFLLVGKWMYSSALLICVMSLFFFAAIGAAWMRGIDVQCGCFGATEANPSYGWLLLRDIGLGAAAAMIMLWNKTYEY